MVPEPIQIVSEYSASLSYTSDTSATIHPLIVSLRERDSRPLFWGTEANRTIDSPWRLNLHGD